MKTDPEHSLFGGIANANNHGTDPIDDFQQPQQFPMFFSGTAYSSYPIWWSLWRRWRYGSNPSKGGQLSQVRKSQKACWKSLVST